MFGIFEGACFGKAKMIKKIESWSVLSYVFGGAYAPDHSFVKPALLAVNKIEAGFF